MSQLTQPGLWKSQGSSCWQNDCCLLKPANTRHVLSQNIDYFKQVDSSKTKTSPFHLILHPLRVPIILPWLRSCLDLSLPLSCDTFYSYHHRFESGGLGGFCDPPLSKLIIRDRSTKKTHKDNKLTGRMNPRKAMTQHSSTSNNSFGIRNQILTKPKCSLQSTITCNSLLRKGLQI